MSIHALLRKVAVYTAAFALPLLAAPAAAQTLYGASNGQSAGFGPSSLYTINPATGQAIEVGPIGFDNVTGMAFLPDGRLVASFRADNVGPGGTTAGLLEINPITGDGILIGIIGTASAGSCGRMPDITWDASRSTLFGYGDFCGASTEGLFTIDPLTGAGTSVGPSGYGGGGNGLAAEPGTGTLYATPFDNQSLVTLDAATGAGTNVPGSVGALPFRVNALDFHPDTGTLFGSWNDGGGSSLITIDPANGTPTTVGPTITGLDALAFERDFEPTEFARFRVTKNFSDDNVAEVPITITCNTGLPLEQHWDLSESSSVNFTVGDFEQGTLDCSISEDEEFPGYTASYNDGSVSADSCSWTDLEGLQYYCAITNTLDQVEVEVTKEWIDENPQFAAVNLAEANWSCSNVAHGSSYGWLEFFGSSDTRSFYVYPDWEFGTDCDITEVSIADSGVETDDSDCQNIELFPGGGASCTIVNTRLYEGIPTLSQYGLAILSLLVLGLGMVAFRRYS